MAQQVSVPEYGSIYKTRTQKLCKADWLLIDISSQTRIITARVTMGQPLLTTWAYVCIVDRWTDAEGCLHYLIIRANAAHSSTSGMARAESTGSHSECHEQAVGNIGQMSLALPASGPSPRKWNSDAVQDVTRAAHNVGKCLAWNGHRINGNFCYYNSCKARPSTGSGSQWEDTCDEFIAFVG